MDLRLQAAVDLFPALNGLVKPLQRILGGTGEVGDALLRQVTQAPQRRCLARGQRLAEQAIGWLDLLVELRSLVDRGDLAVLRQFRGDGLSRGTEPRFDATAHGCVLLGVEEFQHELDAAVVFAGLELGLQDVELAVEVPGSGIAFVALTLGELVLDLGQHCRGRFGDLGDGVGPQHELQLGASAREIACCDQVGRDGDLIQATAPIGLLEGVVNGRPCAGGERPSTMPQRASF